jgi:hypothetical protein
MNKTLFLYLDILGFSELIKTPRKADQLFATLDSAALHRDSNFRAIAFSDTLLAYHTHDELKGSGKAVELMYLIEMVQDIFIRLIGSGIYFRAIITEGAFHHSQLKHLQAYYGQALIEAYQKEKSIIGTGLYLDRKLDRFNQVFRSRPYSQDYSFVFLTHTITKLTPRLADVIEGFEVFADPDFPIPGEVLTMQDLHYGIYPEFLHLREVYTLRKSHPSPDIRAKHLATWDMYEQAYPKLIKSLIASECDVSGIADMDWSVAKNHFEESTVWKAQSGI